MNPMTNVKNIQKLNERMLDMGVEDGISWHKQYKDSAYIFIGGLPYDLTEGDILCVFSQYGEIVNVNLVRDKKTGKQKGFCFLCYEDQRSTILAVDNFNGIKLGGRTIRVDHCSNYRKPKGDEKDEDGNRKEILEEGCAPKVSSPSPSEDELEPLEPVKKKNKVKKEKRHKKQKEKKSKRKEANSSSSESEDEKYTKHEKHKEKKSNKTKPYHEQDFSNAKRNTQLQEKSHHKDSLKEREEKTRYTREWDYGKQTEREDRHDNIKQERRDRNEQSSQKEESSLDYRDRRGERQRENSRERYIDRRYYREYESQTRDRSRDNKYSDRERDRSGRGYKK